MVIGSDGRCCPATFQRSLSILGSWRSLAPSAGTSCSWKPQCHCLLRPIPLMKPHLDPAGHNIGHNPAVHPAAWPQGRGPPNRGMPQGPPLLASPPISDGVVDATGDATNLTSSGGCDLSSADGDSSVAFPPSLRNSMLRRLIRRGG